MKLARFSVGDKTVMGVVVGDRVLDLSAAAPDMPETPLEFLAAGPAALDRARALQDSMSGWFDLTEVELLAPIDRPGKFVAIGLNYLDHIEETGRTSPEFPVFFTKQSTCVIGPGQNIEVPAVSPMVDFEGELAVVIGKRCRHVPPADAFDVIAGCTIVNDVTVRDWQRKAPTMMIGKSFDTHGPMGPWIVTLDELGDPHDLHIKTYLNDELMQDGSTSKMVFNIGEQIATLSTAMTLEPGDVISTGTPAGVGVARDPQVFLRAGDTVRIEIDGIGALSNSVIDATAGR